MAETLFIADLHLDPARPDAIALCHEFLTTRARHSAGLYILGDLFEYWIGDDQPVDGLTPVLDALAALGAAGVPVYCQHGNRDFLLGADFAARTGLTLLPEAVVVDLYGRPTLLLHGDTLCTDDHAYQALRRQLRDPAWQREFLALPLAERIRQARALRERSMSATREKDEAIMDVNPQAVAEAMRAHGVRHLIHGHTHRPAIHHFTLDDAPAERIVLGDWYRQGSVLSVDAAGARLETLPFSARG